MRSVRTAPVQTPRSVGGRAAKTEASMYSFTGRIRYSETDAQGILTPEKLIDYFQDCSTFQSQDIGAGVESLRRREMAWIIVYWRVEILRMPALGETVRIGTFPYAMKGSVGLRNFFMETESGERLANANSVWTLVNTVSSRPVRVPVDILDLYPPEEKLLMQYDSRKIRIPDLPGTKMDPVRVQEYHLDTNRHMNNGQYVRIAAGFFPPERRVRVLRIEYRQQAMLGDSIVPVVYTYPDGTGEDSADRRPETAAAEPSACAEHTDEGQKDRKMCIALNTEDGRPYAILEAVF